MPKKRKTRKQKVLVDQRKQMVHESASHESISNTVTHVAHATNTEETAQGITFSLPANDKPSVQKVSRPVTTQVAISTDDYGYLGKDLVRTVLLSGAVVIAELLIKTFFKV